MITEDYVSFETAKLLKEKGFDAECKKYYTLKMLSNLYYGCEYVRNRDLKDEDDCIAPSLWMAMKWLREVHNVLVIPDYDYECTDKSYCYKIYRLGESGKPERVPIYGQHYRLDGEPCTDVVGYRDYERSYSDYATYEESCEAAIKYCLENLI